MKDLKAHVATSLVLSELIPIATNLVLNNISFVLRRLQENQLCKVQSMTEESLVRQASTLIRQALWSYILRFSLLKKVVGQGLEVYREATGFPGHLQ